MKTNRMNSNKQATLLMVTLLATGITPVWAQSDAPMDHSTHQSMPGMDMKDAGQPMDHSSMNHSMDQATDQPNDPSMDHSMHSTDQPMDKSMSNSMDHSGHGMTHGAMQGGSAPADARDPHAYSGGYGFGETPPRLRLADQHNFGSLWMNRFEAVRSDDNTSATYDLQAWYGRDYDRVVLKAEGDVDNGELEEGTTELLWGHAVDTYWDLQLGFRYDSGEGPDRGWLALGVQGLAPYWFEIDATAYVGDEGRTAVAVEAEYELLLTQKLILQPRLEANLYGKDDPELALGAGLADLSAGIRLRYEIRREFAPYIGIEWLGKFGDTADYARAAGGSKDETVAVAGVRFWF